MIYSFITMLLILRTEYCGDIVGISVAVAIFIVGLTLVAHESTH